MAGAARETIHDVFARRGRRRAEFFHVAHQFLVMEDLLEVRPWNSQRENGSVAVHLWRDSGVERVGDSQLAGQRNHAGLVGKIASHEDVGDADLQLLRLQESNCADGLLQRPREFCDGIVNLRPMGVDADLYLLDAELAKSRGFLFMDHYAVGLHLHVEQQLPRPLHDFKKVAAHQNFTAAEREKEDAGIGELFEHIDDFRRRHLAMIVVIEVAMHAALIAAVGDIEVNADGQTQVQRFLIHLGEKAHWRSGEPEESSRGWCDTSRMPCCESSSTKRSAPRCACSRSTSNSWQILPATISDSGVRPSAACQIAEATSLSVKKVESAADITIISPPSMRAAIALLRAIYFSAIMILRELTYYVPDSLVGDED